MAWPTTVRKADLRIDYYRGSGKGGQHRNKTDSACRINHLPTGQAASAEEFKSQAQNRRAAFRRLAEKLVPLMKKALAPQVPEQDLHRRVRTYHQPRGQVKDSRTPGQSWDYETVLSGKALSDIIGALDFE